MTKKPKKLPEPVEPRTSGYVTGNEYTFIDAGEKMIWSATEEGAKQQAMRVIGGYDHRRFLIVKVVKRVQRAKAPIVEEVVE